MIRILWSFFRKGPMTESFDDFFTLCWKNYTTNNQIVSDLRCRGAYVSNKVCVKRAILKNPNLTCHFPETI